jgi:hypothetical protein
LRVKRRGLPASCAVSQPYHHNCLSAGDFAPRNMATFQFAGQVPVMCRAYVILSNPALLSFRCAIGETPWIN